ncbi:MAG: hypothetical protein WKF35_09855 [Ferruginibacter sp.]
MKLFNLTTFLFILFFISCKKTKDYVGGIAPPYQIPSPYQEPVWHPNGQILGFNHTPYKLVANQNPTQFIDSAGFWLINASGTDKRRVLNFRANSPAWSPDGNWLAYSDGATIYKIRFTGTSFDLSQNVSLTSNGKNFFPCWNATSDSLVFDSNDGTNDGSYRTWKMASDGTGKTLVGVGRQPRWSANHIYFIGSDSPGVGIFRVNTNSQNKIKIVNQPNEPNNIRSLRIWNNYLFYQLDGLGINKGTINSANFFSITTEEISNYGFDISLQGKIAYVLYNGKVTTTQGTIWIMNNDGTGKKQLTYTNY